jgi:methionyl-tRNA formyltransferase
MKFGFVTCVQLGKSCMEAIYEVGGRLDLVITLEDSQAVDKSGRVYLDEFCLEREVELFKSSHVNNVEVIEKIKAERIDWLFIIGWSQIASANLLAAASRGVIGIHPTLLPEGRGRAAIPWAILKGLKRTGVTMFKLDDGVDTGDILEQLTIPLNESVTATALYEKVNIAHIDLMKRVFPKLNSDNVKLIQQDNSKATEWPGRKPSDGKVDLSGSVFDAERLIRAVTRPYPGAYAQVEGRTYLIWKAEIVAVDSAGFECSSNILRFRDGSLLLLEFEIFE